MNELGKTGDGVYPPPEVLKELLKSSQTIAVVGISANEERPSHGVASYLQEKGYKIIPVNPTLDEVLGEKAYPDLKSVDVAIDIVDVFRRPEEAVAIVNDAIKIGVKAIWLQESVVSDEAFKLGKEAGLTMVMDRCILKKHRELIG